MSAAGQWRAERARHGNTEFASLWIGDERLSFHDLFRLLQEEAEFADWYSGLLAASPCAAFFWEHPPLTAANITAQAEFVLVDAPILARLKADPAPFRACFDGADIVTFRNLGGDALLVAPSPGDPKTDCAHLAAFLRTASASRQQAMWRSVGRAVCQSLSAAPLWLSTSGTGVAWLHVRLDASPKYYQHRPYAKRGQEN
jgi:hypothetical protein